ncbi:MAG: hypothetical protein KGJ57_01850 [Sphingomonadales bacterium]|nr:hypothetical protein [Sphingomonadales bacterium]MDE2168153.1 hypothetical protein [Sphingomonadales bacterium]
MSIPLPMKACPALQHGITPKTIDCGERSSRGAGVSGASLVSLLTDHVLATSKPRSVMATEIRER